MLGDGNIYRNKKFHAYQLRIAGHEKYDKEYLSFVKVLIEELFDIEAYYKHHSDKSKKAMYICTSKRKVCEFVESVGVPTGNKKTQNAGIPLWILEEKELMEACIRGLFDTDASLAKKTPKHPCPSIWYESAIPQLRENVSYCLNQLGFHPSKWTKTTSHGVLQLCLGRREEVIRFSRTIGFNNKKHKNKLLGLP